MSEIAMMRMRYWKNFLLEYEIEFTCFICEFNVVKSRNESADKKQY